MDADDPELVRRFVDARDQAAFRLLVERHAPLVLRAAHAVTRDRHAAEDVTQETFLAASRAMGRLRDGSSVRAWLAGIAFRKAISAVRARNRAEARERSRAMDETAGGVGPDAAAERREAASLVDAALGALPPDRRAAVLLHYRDGLSLAEVAEATGVSAGTAKSRIGRALDELRRALAARGALLAPAPLLEILRAHPAPQPGATLLRHCGSAALAPAAAGAGSKLAIAAALLAAVATAGALALREEAPARASLAAATGGDEVMEPSAPGVDPRPAPEIGDGGGAPATEADGAIEPAPGAGPSTRDDELVVVAEGAAEAPGLDGGNFVARGFSKFAPAPPEKGRATVRGVVRDETGRPVPGASVWRLAADAEIGDEEVLSFEFLREVATSGADGTFVAADQAHGTFLLVADFQRVQLRPRGMDVSLAAAVTVADGGAAEDVELKVPVVYTDLGAVRGRVVDEAGRPMRRVRVVIDQVERSTDGDGRFDAVKVVPGRSTVLATHTGYRDARRSIEVARAQEVEVSLTMALEETGGLELPVRVVETSGAPIAGAQVFLCTSSDTVRAGETDADGRFRFERLPDRLASEGANLVVWAEGYFTIGEHAVSFPSGERTLAFPRAVTLCISVTDAAGEPLRKIRGEARRRAGEEWRMFRAFSVYAEDGVYAIEAPAAPVQLEIEAEGHESATFEVAPATGESLREVPVRLRRADGDASDR